MLQFSPLQSVVVVLVNTRSHPLGRALQALSRRCIRDHAIDEQSKETGGQDCRRDRAASASENFSQDRQDSVKTREERSRS